MTWQPKLRRDLPLAVGAYVVLSLLGGRGIGTPPEFLAIGIVLAIAYLARRRRASSGRSNANPKAE